jgi:hypothetical protein
MMVWLDRFLINFNSVLILNFFLQMFSTRVDFSLYFPQRNLLLRSGGTPLRRFSPDWTIAMRDHFGRQYCKGRPTTWSVVAERTLINFGSGSGSGKENTGLLQIITKNCNSGLQCKLKKLHIVWSSRSSKKNYAAPSRNLGDLEIINCFYLSFGNPDYRDRRYENPPINTLPTYESHCMVQMSF